MGVKNNYSILCIKQTSCLALCSSDLLPETRCALIFPADDNIFSLCGRRNFRFGAFITFFTKSVWPYHKVWHSVPIKRQPISGRTYACLCPNTIIKIIISHFVYNVKAISVNLCQMTRIFQKKSDRKKAKRTKICLFAQPVEQDIELVKLYKKLREVALSKTFHRNVLEV